jgi:hypothetical protein
MLTRQTSDEGVKPSAVLREAGPHDRSLVAKRSLRQGRAAQERILARRRESPLDQHLHPAAHEHLACRRIAGVARLQLGSFREFGRPSPCVTI